MFKNFSYDDLWEMLFDELKAEELVEYQEVWLELDSEKFKFCFEEVEDEGWEDEGKYSNNGYVFRVSVYDAEGGFVEDLDLYIKQYASRTGSYYSDYYYEYEEPFRVTKIKKIVEVEEWVQYGK